MTQGQNVLVDAKMTVDADVTSAEHALEALQRAFAQHTKAVRKASKEYKDLVKRFDEGEDVAIEQAKAFERLTLAQTQMADTQKRMRLNVLGGSEAMRQQSNAAQRARRQIEALGAEARRFGDVESRLLALSRGVSATGIGRIRGLEAAAEVLSVTEAVKLLKLELPALTDTLTKSGKYTQLLTARLQTLGPGMSAAAAKTTVMVGSLAAIGGAMIALGLAMAATKKIIDASADATKQFISINKKYAEIVTTSTSKEVEEIIAQNEERIAALQKEREALAFVVQSAEDMGGFAGALLDVNDALGLNLGGQEDLNKALLNVNSEIIELTSLNRGLTGALQDGATAARDAISAQQEQERADRDYYAKRARIAAQEGLFYERLQMERKSMTEEEAQSRLDALETERKANLGQIEYLQSEVARGAMAPEDIAPLVDVLVARNDTLSKELFWLGEVVKEARSREAILKNTEEQLKKATEAEKARLAAFIQGLDDEMSARLRYHDLAQSASSESLAQMEDELEFNKRLLNDAIARLGVEILFLQLQGKNTEALQAYLESLVAQRDIIDEDRAAIDGWIEAAVKRREVSEELTSVSERLAQAAEKTREALEKQAEAERKFARDREKAARDLETKLGENLADLMTSMSRDEEDFWNKRADSLAKQYLDLARMDEDYYDKRQTILDKASKAAHKEDKNRLDKMADYNKKLRRLAEDHRRRILDINRGMIRGVEAAVEDRSVSAAIEAVRSGKEQLESENENYKVRKKRMEEDFGDQLKSLTEQRKERLKQYGVQLRDLARQHQKLRSRRIQDFNNRILIEDRERQLRTSREKADFDLKDQRARKHFSDQWDIWDGGMSSLTEISQTMFGGVVDFASQAAAQLALALKTNPVSLMPPLPAIGGALADLFKPLGFAEGGSPPVGQSVRVGERGPETVRFMSPARVFRAGQGGGDNFSFSFTGQNVTTAREIEAVFEHRIVPKLKRAVRRARRN